MRAEAPGLPVAAPRVLLLAVVTGVALLAGRDALVAGIPDNTGALIGIFSAVGGLGLVSRVPEEPRLLPSSGTVATVLVLLTGLAAFVAIRAIEPGVAPGPLTTRAVLLTSLAAVAEELFFRRLVFGWLKPLGAPIAIGCSALLFAVVHVPVYGIWVLPIDLTAGLVLAWQRWASGSWLVPGITHVLINVAILA